jgi:hypothetical protein
MSRSFTLSLFVLLWLFLVPVPGVFVVSAGDYHIYVGLRELGMVAGVALLLVMGTATSGWIVRMLERRGASGAALDGRLSRLASVLGVPWMNGVASAREVARTCAELTELQMCMDQWAHVRARACLARVEDWSLKEGSRPIGRGGVERIDTELAKHSLRRFNEDT